MVSEDSLIGHSREHIDFTDTHTRELQVEVPMYYQPSTIIET